jgi:outer membrane protein OmpA-like peptidoglycan-associated protein
MKKINILIILVFGFYLVASAVKVEGIVIDKDTEKPLADAVILAISNNNVLANAKSNAKGEFVIDLKKGKTIRLEVVKNGYKTENATVEINDEFIAAAPFITIKLMPKPAVKTINMSTSNKDETMEDVGNLSALPEGYKIIEAVPIKEDDNKITGFNVRPEVKDQTTNVNVDVLKTEYNKDLQTDAVIPNHNFTTSYFKDGAIYYNVGKAFLSADVEEVLKGVALKLKNDESTLLKLEVHSDANQEANITDFICKMRIEEIVKYLLSEGVDFKQLDISIIGRQLIKNGCELGVECPDEKHQENRKVALTFLK